MLIALTGDKDTSQLDMRQLAEYKLRTRLLAIPGVGQVTVLGGRLPEYQVIYDPNKLKLAGVDLSSLKTAIQERPVFPAPGDLLHAGPAFFSYCSCHHYSGSLLHMVQEKQKRRYSGKRGFLQLPH